MDYLHSKPASSTNSIPTRTQAASHSSSGAVPDVPSIPRHSRQAARGKSIQDPSALARPDEEGTRSVQPASPEVISSLITSLSVISKPAAAHFDQPTGTGPPLPETPGGSFGVDYGAYSQPSSVDRPQDAGVDLDELAASSPTIRTAKPPSGFSPLTAPKSPRSPLHTSGGLKSLLRNGSRPSSRGSGSSRDDTRSIGNLSIEPGVVPAPELKRQRSHDSWGKKQGRNSKGLMYMSSKERLRVSEEKRRASTSSTGASSVALPTSHSSKPDPFLAHTPITEEPGTNSDSQTPTKVRDSMAVAERSPSIGTGAFERPIPDRDSSLRRTGPNVKRSSQKSTKSRRESADATIHDSIPEDGENGRSGDIAVPKRRHQVKQDSGAEARRREEILRADLASSPKISTFPSSTRHASLSSHLDERVAAAHPPEDMPDEGAPFPSVYSGRRRSLTTSLNTADRRRSGRTTPEPSETLRTKRSSSRLKRLSAGNKSPEPGDKRKDLSPTPEPHVGYERPISADSIDDAVESYLCSPRLSQKIKHPQTGRVISFSEVGDSEGSAVFCCVGMGLTRYITAFYDELALTLKLRLITPDRPGVGDSEAYTDGTATPLSWPDDVYAICQALKITKFSILAHSAGAIYALATALRMPQHIRGRIHLLAPWIPPSQMNVFGNSQALPPTNSMPTSQRILRALPTPFLKAANSSFMSATSSSITSSLPKSSPRRAKRKSTTNLSEKAKERRDATLGMDKENTPQPDGADAKGIEDNTAMATENMDQIRPAADFSNGETAILAAATDALVDKERQMTYDTRLTHAIWELATTGANPAVDLLVCLERRHTIGFRYVDITRPVIIHHGSKDTRVPVENVKWLGKTMRRCEVRILEGEGHGLMASAGVMGSVLMEISREWEDWMRVTGTSRERAKSVRASAAR